MSRAGPVRDVLTELAGGRWWGGRRGYVAVTLVGFLVPLTAVVIIDPLRRAEAWAFYALIGLMALYVAANAVRNHHLTREHDREVDQLVRTMNAFRDEALTMPPERFLDRYDESYRRVAGLAESYRNFASDAPAQQAAQRDEIDHSIRTVLDIILNLAWVWDRQEAEGAGFYRANVMIVRWAGELADAAVQERLAPGLRLFSPPDQTRIMEQARAVVDLDLALTTNSLAFGNPERDALDPLALPVFGDDADDDLVNLPGAPVAAAWGGTSYVAEITAVARQINREEAFDPDSRRRLRAYYRRNAKASSLVSLPIRRFSARGQGEATLGVLNLYVDQPRILGSERRAGRFAMLCTPYLTALADLLFVHWLAERAQRRLEPGRPDG